LQCGIGAEFTVGVDLAGAGEQIELGEFEFFLIRAMAPRAGGRDGNVARLKTGGRHQIEDKFSFGATKGPGPANIDGTVGRARQVQTVERVLARA